MRLVPLLLLAPVVGFASAFMSLPASSAEPTDSCLATCNTGKMSADDRATCRLGCQPAAPRPVVNTPPPSPPPASQPQSPPASQPSPPASQPPSPPASQPPSPPASQPQSPPASSQPPPVQPPPTTYQPTPVQPPPATYQPPPTYPPAPTPQTSVASCEASCASEPVDDRSTCRLQCAQQSRPPSQLPTNGGFQPSAPQAYVPPPTYSYPTPPSQPNYQPATPTYVYPRAQPQPATPTYVYPPAQPQYQPATPTYVYPPAQPQPTYNYPPAQPTTTSKSPQEIASCQSACTGGSSTDRATCRLNCASQSTVVTPSTSYNVLWGNPQQNEAANRAAVIRQSNNVAGQAYPTYPQSPPPATYQPPPTQPPATTTQPRPPVTAPPPQPADQARAQQCAAQSQSCIVGCAESLVPCNQSCDQGRMSSTDRATCKLTCEGNVDVCTDDCRARERSCAAGR